MALIGSRTLQRKTKELLDGIERDGEPVVVLRRGQPVAALIPIDQEHAEALVLATSPEFKERRQARESSEEQQVRTIEDVVQELDRRLEISQGDEADASAAEEPSEYSKATADAADAAPLIDEIAQTILGVPTATGGMEGEASLDPEISERVKDLTAAIERSVQVVSTADSAGLQPGSPTYAVVNEISQRQRQSSLMLAHFLRASIESSIAVDTALNLGETAHPAELSG